MNHKGTLIGLLLAIIGVGSLIVWDQHKTQSEELEQKTAKLIITDFDFSSINFIKINNPKSDIINLTLNELGWFVATPIYYAADQQVISQFLTSLRSLKYDQLISKDRAVWPRYELDQPQATVTVKNAKGQSVTVSLGAKTQTGYGIYLGIEHTQTVYVAGYGVFNTLNKSLFELRNKHLVTIDTQGLKELTYRSPEPLVVKFQVADNRFQMTSPQKLPTSQNELTSFMADLQNLKALSIEDTPSTDFLKRFANSTAFYEISWTLNDRSTKRIELSVVDGSLWGTDSHNKVYLRFDLQRDQRKIRKTLFDFREKRVLNFSEDLDKLVINQKNIDLTLSSNQQRLNDISYMEVKEFIKQLPKDLDVEQADYQLKLSRDDQPEEVWLIWSLEQGSYAKSSIKSDIYKLDADLKTQLEALISEPPRKT